MHVASPTVGNFRRVPCIAQSQLHNHGSLSLPHLFLKFDCNQEFLVLRMVGAMGAFAMGRNSLTLLTEFASYPLTVLWGLQEAAKLTDGIPHLGDRKSLVVHIVGAELPFECKFSC